MWQQQVMEGEDFASPVAELAGGKPDPEVTDLPHNGEWRWAPRS
jgi:hypothetical protein